MYNLILLYENKMKLYIFCMKMSIYFSYYEVMIITISYSQTIRGVKNIVIYSIRLHSKLNVNHYS